MSGELTPEQADLIPVYWQKWRQIGLSTAAIDLPAATAAVQAAYGAIGLPAPEIQVFPGPHSALQSLTRLTVAERGQPVFEPMRQVLLEPVQQLMTELQPVLEPPERYFGQLLYEQTYPLWSTLYAQFLRPLVDEFGQFELLCDHSLLPEFWCHQASQFDFCVECLNYPCSPTWKIAQALIQHCGWVFPFEQVCLVCDRPRQFSLDAQHRLHAEGEPALAFADGYHLYSYHGVTLPEQYGQVQPHQWQAAWLLTETNAELRRVLIQGLGYARICQQLQAVELDAWQDYTLLKVDMGPEQEPCHLLKMICPSTGYVHVLRVPPQLTSARAAIGWVNWGTDPEEFATQT